MIIAFYAPENRGFGPWRQAFLAACEGVDLRFAPNLGDPTLIEAAIVWAAPAAWFDGLPALRVVHSLGAGVDHLPMGLLRDRGIAVLRLADPDLTGAMVDYCLAQVLRLHLNDPAYRRQQAERLWHPILPGVAHCDRRVSILGLGTLGAACAARLAAHGFSVSGWSRTAKSIAGIRCFQGADGLVQMARETDILICLLPLTDETRGIMNADLFAHMPQGAMVVNAARGGHLVEDDLLTALGTGQIAEAILDVTGIEPLPEAHPFWAHPRISLTPHVAAITNPATAAAIILGNLDRFAAGLPVAQAVDPARGY